MASADISLTHDATFTAPLTLRLSDANAPSIHPLHPLGCCFRARSEPSCRPRAKPPLMFIRQGQVRIPDRLRWRMPGSVHCHELAQYCMGAKTQSITK